MNLKSAKDAEDEGSKDEEKMGSTEKRRGQKRCKKAKRTGEVFFT